jgi:hypothetical protein
MSARTKRQRIVVAFVIGGVSLGIVVASFASMRADGAGAIPFAHAFVHLVVMLSVFNVIDLLLLDWPLVAIAPRFVVLPGTEGSPGYKDYRFHLRGFVIGTILIVPVSGMIAAVIAALF